MTRVELVSLVCCDLGAIVRGRSLPLADLDSHLAAGVGWVPANHALTPLGPLAEPNPFGSIGDLRLLPDASTRARVEAGGDASSSGPGSSDSGSSDSGPSDSGSSFPGSPDPGPLDLLLCDIVEIDGRPWECCPRHWLREGLAELEREQGLRVMASFEHELVLVGPPEGAASSHAPAALPFSLEAQRCVEPFGADVMGALIEAGVQPERFFPEYAPHQFEIPVRPAEGVAAADRSVVLMEVVREIARRHGLRASFSPLLDPAQAGNGAHIHLALVDANGVPALYDPTRSGCLSELGERFAAGILAHAPALTALTAPSPLSAARLTPHHWGAGAACLGLRNREALLRIPPLVSIGGAPEADQLRLEYRAADATANPYLALGAIVRAGLDGLRAGLPAPPILDRDPARLTPAEAERYGVGALPASLADSLQALAEDAVARSWMKPLLYDAYTGVRRAELHATADWDPQRTAARYASVY
jgi:glutamine synthetase